MSDKPVPPASSVDELDPERNRAIRERLARSNRWLMRFGIAASCFGTVACVFAAYAFFVIAPNAAVEDCINASDVREIFPSKLLFLYPSDERLHVCERLTKDEAEAVAKDPKVFQARLNRLGYMWVARPKKDE